MSTPINDGGPAFPGKGVVGQTSVGGGPWTDKIGDFPGMTLRDYFAGQALAGIMAGVCTGHQISKPGQTIKVDESVHDAAYAAADKMLAAREGKK